MDSINLNNDYIVMANFFEPFITCKIKFNELTCENDLYIINANKHFSSIIEKPTSEVLNKKFSEIYPITKTSIFDWSQILINAAVTYESKVIEQYFDGFNKFLRLFVFGYDNGIFHVIIQDITYKKQFTRIMIEKNRQIEYLVEDMRSKNDRDSLTGLYNYQFALDSLESSIKNYNEEGMGFSLLLLDILNIKRYNEKYGYKQVDKLLVQVAESIMSNTRKIDVACRYNGDKFLIIYNNVDSDIAKILIDRLKKSIKKTIILYDGSEMFLNGSSIDYTGQEREPLIINLEEKLRKSKLLGPDVVL